MVAKEPQDRQQSMTEVIVELEMAVGVLSGRSAKVGAKVESSSGALATTLDFLREHRSVSAMAGPYNSTVAEKTQPSISQPETGTNIFGKVKGAVGAARCKPLVLAGIAGGVLLVLGVILAIMLHHGGGRPSTEDSVPSTQSDDPPPAVAPFDEKKAKEHQAAWAKHLGVPVEITNSIGTKFG